MIFGVLSVLAAAVLVGVDQLIKRWATAVLLPKTAMTLIPGVLELRYSIAVENSVTGENRVRLRVREKL